MHFDAIARFLGNTALVALLAAGCATTSHTTHTNGSSTPQEKVHRDQLSAMGRQDGESVGVSSKTSAAAPKPATSRRRTGQGVIDQPIRR